MFRRVSVSVRSSRHCYSPKTILATIYDNICSDASSSAKNLKKIILTHTRQTRVQFSIKKYKKPVVWVDKGSLFEISERMIIEVVAPMDIRTHLQPNLRNANFQIPSQTERKQSQDHFLGVYLVFL